MSPIRIAATATAGALAGSAAFVQGRTRAAQARHPPMGRFVDVEGARLHYVEAGEGPPLVLLHGLGSMVDDFMLSGLVREASKRYRVLAFDRPGYGYSSRPANLWGPRPQARMVAEALDRLEAHRPIVLGHSWGTLVAAELALLQPAKVRSLVLASGMYFPTPRIDAPFLAPPGIPLLGAIWRHTLGPLAARAMWPVFVRMLFHPAPVPEAFSRFPTWLALRPSQLGAVGKEGLATLPATLSLTPRYPQLDMPVTLVAGARDGFVSPRAHTQRLHELLPHSKLMVSPHAGHMVHYTDLPLVLSAIEAAAWPPMA